VLGSSAAEDAVAPPLKPFFSRDDFTERTRQDPAQFAGTHATRAPAPAALLGDRHAFFLDLDGTLIEHAPTPDSVTVDAALLELLNLLAVRSGGAIALVSGRTIACLDSLLRPLRLPASGLHGFERRSWVGTQTRGALPCQQTLEDARGLMAQAAATDPRVILEDKNFAFALHYRRAPHLEDALVKAVMAIAARLGDTLEMQRGHRVVELIPRGASKATAIADFMRERPFHGRRPLYLGDDLTDEPAFEWVNAAGGLSVAVNVTHPTAALAHLGSVSEARTWLHGQIEPPR
jgi:trehalose 6-phosphate phosphatase